MTHYEFIGWERDEEKNVDKVWGVICISEPTFNPPNLAWVLGTYVSFWGRRGKKLSTKVYTNETQSGIRKIWVKKHSEGYTEIHEQRLAEVYPEFQDDLEKTAVWALLSN